MLRSQKDGFPINLYRSCLFEFPLLFSSFVCSLGQPGYDPTSLYIPPSAMDKFTPAEKQYWEIKQKNMDLVLFFKIGLGERTICSLAADDQCLFNRCRWMEPSNSFYFVGSFLLSCRISVNSMKCLMRMPMLVSRNCQNHDN